ncbi:MAG TPA: AAA family ATPase [Gaiellaceae bacterium]|nr:AAA family ATPase [Gaiellaceae bacterium]
MEVIGRHREMAGMDRFLNLVAGGPAALVLEGDPGIGKTTVWRAAVEAARSRSYRVLSCRASESERALSFLGLGDLLDDVSDEALELLPEPQRLALELALLRSAGESSPDRVSVARGTLNVLRAWASEGPIVVAIDDVQWLDAPSADVVRFVVHRLSDERLGLLVSVRNGEATSLLLDHAFPGGGLARLQLESLSFEELEEVVRLHLAVSFTRPTWRALHRISGGNPFFALQLGEALERRGERLPGDELPIPETLADAVRERLTVLSQSARAALLPVAALAQPTLSLTRAGAAEAQGVEEAVQAGVLQIDGERLRFAHPLLASFVYADASEAERQAVHRRLAALVAEPEENALHLARGTVEPDESVSATLEASADRAAKRGHPEIAAELAEHSERLTPAERTGDRSRRVCKAATYLYTAGDGQRSRALLEELVAWLPRSVERARAFRLLGWFVDDLPRCTALLEQALDETGHDLQLRSQVLSFLAMKESWRGNWNAASRHLRKAVELAERSGGGAALATARARLAWVVVGPTQLPEIERAVELERSLPDILSLPESPSFLKGVVLLAVDRLDEARRQLEESYERGVALGDTWRVVHLGWLAELELRAGNWKRALAHARSCEELGRQLADDAGAWGAWARALVEAHLGNVAAAVEAGERASRLARATGFHWGLSRSELALGFLHLSAGHQAAALDHLLPLLEERAEISLHPSVVAGTLSNTIEALVGAGDLGHAASLASRLEEHARAMPVPSAIASAARCRALVLAQGGDLPISRGSIEEALAAHARLREPFELARTYLAQGSIERRAKQKAEARAALGQAEAIFAELGARLWLERARAELARTGLTRSLDRKLSPTELRVAELAAEGAQNKEIAGALFVSVKTVEANLSRVYAKLGIRSRVELASQLPRRGQRESGRATQG